MKYYYLFAGFGIGMAIYSSFIQPKQVSRGYTRTQIVHDYIFERGKDACAEHQGFHYVVAQTEIKEIGPSADYPCRQTVKFRCQDGTVHNFDTGVGFCFISESQLKKTL